MTGEGFIVVGENLQRLVRLVFLHQQVVAGGGDGFVLAVEGLDLVHRLEGPVVAFQLEIQVDEVEPEVVPVREILQQLLVRFDRLLVLPVHGIGDGQGVAVPEVAGVDRGRTGKMLLRGGETLRPQFDDGQVVEGRVVVRLAGQFGQDLLGRPVIAQVHGGPRIDQPPFPGFLLLCRLGGETACSQQECERRDDDSSYQCHISLHDPEGFLQK